MRKGFKLFLSIIFTSVIIFTLSSCGSSKWEFTKAEAGDFIPLNAAMSKADNDQYKISLNADDSIFKNDISDSDVLLYDVMKLNAVTGYIKYSDMKDNLVDVDNVEFVNDKEINIIFNTEEISDFGILVHKKALTVDTFAYGITRILDANKKVITDYEETLIKQKGGWNAANTGIQMMNYITQMVIGFVTEQPAAFTGGLFGLVTTLGGSFLNTSPSMADISKQITVVDAKIDAMAEQIDANQKEILDEFVRTQAMIDQVLVNQYNQNITAYQTDYVKPLDDYLAFYKDDCEQSLKQYVQSGKTVSVYYGTNDIIYVTEATDAEIAQATKVDFNISEFSNAKSYIEKNKGIVGDKFAEELYKDITTAVNNVPSLPQGRSKDKVIEDVYKTLNNDVNYAVLSKDDGTLHRDVMQFISNFVSFAKSLAGVNVESVINSYVSRLEYMYNFTYEIKSVIRELFASIKLSLDKYMCIVNTACEAQQINRSKEIGEAYDAAADYIKAKYDQQMAMPDNYSYIVKNVVSGDFYNEYANVYYTNLGNSPDFHASFILKNNLSFDGGSVIGDVVNINDINMVGYSSTRALATRYNILKRTGLTKEETFIHYLASCGIVSYSDIDMAYRVFNSGRTFYRYSRILTSFNIRDLNDSDNLRMWCQCYGNPDGYYFNVGHEYNYRYSDSNASSKYWSGKLAYGDIVTCETGELSSDKVVSAYAKYQESHFYWVDDEHWGFNNDVFGEYFFILSIG